MTQQWESVIGPLRDSGDYSAHFLAPRAIHFHSQTYRRAMLATMIEVAPFRQNSFLNDRAPLTQNRRITNLASKNGIFVHEYTRVVGSFIGINLNFC